MPSIVTTSSRKPKGKVGLPVLLAAILVVAAAVLFHLLPAKSQIPAIPKSSAQPPQAPLASVPTNESPIASEDIAEVDSEPVALKPIDFTKVIRPSGKDLALTNNVIRANGCGVVRVAESNVISRTPAQFTTKTEKFLSAYIKSSKHPAMIFPSMSPEMEADCIKALQTDIVIYEDDSEEIQAHKEAVAALKQDLLKAREEGYSVTDCLNEMRKVNNANVRERSRMQHQLNHLLQDGDAEGAVKFFNEANALLAECGLPPILYLEEKYFGKGRRQKGAQAAEEDGKNESETEKAL